MSYTYEPFGPFAVPFELPRKNYKRVDQQAVKTAGTFWDDLDKAHPNLSCALGCYIFSIKASQGFRPWYVGQAKGKRGFRQEVFQSHKLVYMNDVLAKITKGTPVIHLLARQTPKGKFSTNVNSNHLDYLETLLIGMALKQNKELCNIRGTKLLQNVIVPGITGGGGKGGGKRESRRTLKKVLGV